MTTPHWDYSNLSGRPPGPFITLAGRFLSGVREVQADVAPYAAAWEHHNKAALTASGPLWVSMGDSMAQSIGASRFDRGWAGQLAGVLPTHRHVNLSVSGGVIEDLIERQIPAMNAIGVSPDLVTVVIGSNDLFNRRRRRALPQSLPKLLAALPTGTVIGSMPGGRPGAVEFNRQLDAAARARGFVIAEFRDPRMNNWRGKLSADKFHPNDLGYAGMAGIVAEAMGLDLDAAS